MDEMRKVKKVLDSMRRYGIMMQRKQLPCV